MNLSPRQQRIVWFVVLAVFTVACAIGGIELSQSATVSGIGYLLLIFGLPLAIIALGIVGFSLGHEK